MNVCVAMVSQSPSSVRANEPNLCWSFLSRVRPHSSSDQTDLSADDLLCHCAPRTRSTNNAQRCKSSYRPLIPKADYAGPCKSRVIGLYMCACTMNYIYSWNCRACTAVSGMYMKWTIYDDLANLRRKTRCPVATSHCISSSLEICSCSCSCRCC